MVQATRQPFVLFQIARAVVGAIGGDHIRAVYGPRGAAQQSCSLRIQHRQVSYHKAVSFCFLSVLFLDISTTRRYRYHCYRYHRMSACVRRFT